MNCDHSLLTYSFFKQPNCILRLFAIRLREIIKVNLLPATVLGAGLSVIFYMIGGSGKLFECILVFLSVISLSVFFSVHYLTIYYLLQPYNPSTEVKSGTYFIIQFVTYVVSFIMIYIKLPVFIFGILCVAFCVIYCLVACILVYRFAPKTFRLRNWYWRAECFWWVTGYAAVNEWQVFFTENFPFKKLILTCWVFLVSDGLRRSK